MRVRMFRLAPMITVVPLLAWTCLVATLPCFYLFYQAPSDNYDCDNVKAKSSRNKKDNSENGSSAKIDLTDTGIVNPEVDREWADNVCGSVKDNICHHILVVNSRKVTFCSAAKVASTTTKQYFYDIADRESDELTIPTDAKFGVHEANWKRFKELSPDERTSAIVDNEWTHVFFWKHVLERFISGYLDKVVNDCREDPTDKPHLAIYHYIQFGFTCEKHTDLESFVEFILTVPNLEGHFAPQTPLCNIKKFPFTNVVPADETLYQSLRDLSVKLGVKHPEAKEATSKHKTGAKEKMVAMFKEKPHLIQKILNMFQEDCDSIPTACDVEDILKAIGKENKAIR